MFMALAIAEFSGSNMTTKPLKSSLKLVDLHFGQTFSFVIKWQLVHAFSLITLFLLMLPLAAASVSFAVLCLGLSLSQSSLPRKGCLAVTPILPELPALPSETAVMRDADLVA